jgi:hypothetical protein
MREYCQLDQIAAAFQQLWKEMDLFFIRWQDD